MNLKASYEEMMQNQLDKWSADIERLEARARLAEAEARVAALEQVDELRAQRDTARSRLAELREAGEGARADLRAGIESAWKSLGDSVRAALDRFE